MKYKSMKATATLLALLAGTAFGAEELVFSFDSGDLQGWKVVEGAFERIVCNRDQFHHSQDKYNKQGTHFLSTLETKYGKPSDAMVGVVESPILLLPGPKIAILVGGGSGASTYVALCNEKGEELLKARGRNAQPLKPVTWDASKWVGQPVFLRVVDGSRADWGHITLEHVVLKGKVDPQRTKARLASRKKVLGKTATVATASPAPGPTNTDALRGAIEHMIQAFGNDYPRGKEFLAKLEKLNPAGGEPLHALKREALIANPLVSGQPILFVSRRQYPRDHHNTATMFQTGECNTRSYKGRGFLKTVHLGKGGEVKTLLDPGPTSIPRDPEVSFDGRKIVFSMRRDIKDNYHIYEINTDGTGLKQLTSAPGVFDIDPLYLADGSIAFTSSRDPKYCMCNRHIMGNLYKMEADGANIHQLGVSTLFEGHGTLMPDGRILYSRWEYVDRNFGDGQGLWVVNPDGTKHAIYWANNTGSPGAVLDARIIPGTQLCLCIFSSCHDRPWGAAAIVDRRRGIDSPDAVKTIWPASARSLVNPKGNMDAFQRVKPKYEDVYPLSKEFFLVSRTTTTKGENTGIFLLDTFGNELHLHSDPLGCFDPMPIAPRQRPAVKPAMRDFKNGPGTFYVQDAYIGTHMKDVKRGSIKYLRVVESPPKKNWTRPKWAQWVGGGGQWPGMNWHNHENKRILGTVPVEEDGSAHFECPSDKFVFFQLLDENGMMIHSMRSGTMIQSGENQGCVGCHENRVEGTPPLKKTPLALKRPPSKLNGWLGAPRRFSYQREVQPIFDKHCVKCHDFNKPAGKKLNLAGDRTLCFNASYTDLWSNGHIKCVGAGPAAIQQAYSWGSHPSKLIKVLREGLDEKNPGYAKHKQIKLSTEEMHRLITWVDINAPYYPYYESAYPKGVCGRAPIDGRKLSKLQQWTKARFVTKHGGKQRAQISFERPELSPCLQKLDKNSPQYKAALATIVAGAEQLKKVPRADMEGFVPCEKDRHRLEKYDRRVAIEMQNREAIRTGKKLYDKDFE